MHEFVLGVKDANSTGAEAIAALVETANSSLSELSSIGGTLQGQADAAVEAAKTAQATADSLELP